MLAMIMLLLGLLAPPRTVVADPLLASHSLEPCGGNSFNDGITTAIANSSSCTHQISWHLLQRCS